MSNTAIKVEDLSKIYRLGVIIFNKTEKTFVDTV
jgi:hypothetical protein